MYGQKWTVHQLAHAILNPDDPVTPERPYVLHWCGDRKCWRPGHLRAGTPAENTADSIRHGTYKLQPQLGAGPTSANSPHAKLTWEKVREIRAQATGARGELTALGRAYGVTRQAIAYVLRGQTWQHDPNTQP